jgi:hypothetical protein
MEDRFTVVKMKFGSHLYGTDTPESDVDYKGVFLPTKRELFISRVPKTLKFSTGDDHSRNTSSDTDVDLHSIHHFLGLACKGETEAIDMLHAPDSMITETSPVWEAIRASRERFYTKNLKAFVGYARKQAAKYGIKGSRLNAAAEFLDKTGHWSVRLEALQLGDIWDKLPTGEHSRYIEDGPKGIRQYQLCGKTLQSTMKIDYARNIVRLFHDNYGARARDAAENKGIDWKAVSHAVRAAGQVYELLSLGTITFPRPEAEFLTDIKTGKLDYLTEVAPHLENMMGMVEKLSEKSTLPEKVDRVYWENFMVDVLEAYYEGKSISE